MTVKDRLRHAVETMTDEARADRARGVDPAPLDDVLAEFDDE